MPVEDTSKIKEKILSVLRFKGPGFPAPIASEIKTSILFTSAFLSELVSDKELKMTNMRVGSSPVYFIPGQEEKLEYFAKQYLKSKEKDAFIMLQEKKILRDKNLEPAIRVALREIKDFAIPIERNDELYWKYYMASEENTKIPEEKSVEIIVVEEPKKEIQEEPKDDKEISEIEIKEEKKAVKKAVKKTTKKKAVQKQDDKFFNRVKEYLSDNKIEITDISGFSKTDLILKVKENKKESLVVAYNKKKLTEEDIINAYKKASENDMEYTILTLGEPIKKTISLIEAIRNLKEIKKID